ncbi:MAG: N-acetyl-gamma-glutamyl-phosphate reductase [Duodenibacillus sp.]|nr:N-acetyl-gamma-glutamyl-phosphate reductase [Duodenibacillus sp.]
MTCVFIDGSSGTTGLRIHQRLREREDIELIVLPEADRKNPAERRRALNSADVVFLCLPDDAAREAVSMVENERVTVIDTSTAHRTNPDFAYGFAELTGHRERIASSRRIANPGCHASGVIALVAPLVEAGLLARDALLTSFSLTGYSGGGKKMIAGYETERPSLLDAPRQYGLTQGHKHLPEIVKECGLTRAPVFCPIVAPYYAGMEVTVALFREQLAGSIEDVRNALRSYYAQCRLVRYADRADEDGFLSAGAFAGRDDMQVCVMGNDERILLVSRFDNLGKGASGAAIQNMNIVLGLDEALGLSV